MNFTKKIVITAACIAAVTGTAILIKGSPGSPGAEDRLPSSTDSASASLRRRPNSARESRNLSSYANELAELKSIIAGEPGPERDAQLDAYLAKMDAEGAKRALDYIVSLGDSRWKDRWKPLKAWAELDPEKAAAWSKKNTSALTENIMGIWAKKDADAAIAWAKANGTPLGGNPYYATIVRNLPDTPDRIDKAREVLMSQPRGAERNETLSSALKHVQGIEATKAFVEKIPNVELQHHAISLTVLQLVGEDPVNVLDWVRSSGFIRKEGDDRISQILQSADGEGKQEEINRYIENLPDGQEKTTFQSALAEVRKRQK